MRTAEPRNFYFGYPTIAESLVNLAHVSFYATRRSGLLAEDRLAPFVLYAVLPLIAIFILASLRWPADRRQLFPLVTLAGGVAVIIAGHYAAGLKYPAQRTGLPVLLLFGIAWAIAAARIRSKRWRGVRIALASLMAIQFATQVHWQYFSGWQFDMRMKQVAGEIKEMSAGSPANSMTVSATWKDEQALEFYRRMLKIGALKPVRRLDPTEFSGHDFYVLSGDDIAAIDQKAIRTVFSDPRSQLIFGVPADKSH